MLQPSKDPKSQNGVLRLLAGSFTDAVSKIWAGSQSAEYVLADDARRHVWHCCLSAESSPFIVREPRQRELIKARMTNARSRDLLIQAFGINPTGLLGLLKRLGTEPREPITYRLAVRAFQKGGAGAKFLMHAQNPSDGLIACIALAPPSITKEVFAKLSSARHLESTDLPWLGWTIERIELKRGKAASQRVTNAPDLVAAICDELVTRDFPSAPWPDFSEFRALSSFSSLRDAGVKMKNCLQESYFLRGAAIKVLSGSHYYYMWEGAEPAMLNFICIPDIGWYLDDFSGFDNAPLSSKLRQEIFEKISSPDMNARGLGDCGSRGSAFRHALLSALA